ncbi:hypothetical protein [uncultured Dokdonia sp.]|uniref:hypothetical protein n=1 Tax=uncultured Dokdonia sp. TaxID=575653 RepID=UPI00263050BF|nr:hypothetical protein [uncultured Dokdonia sp.]
MKFKSIILKSVLALGLVLLSFSACDQKKQEKTTPEAKLEAYSDLAVATSTASTSCDCETNWFPHSQTPAPEEGKGSPFDTENTTNCMFQQWSFQKFLWLTKPEANGKPLFLNTLKQVTNQMETVKIPSGTSVALSSINQAGLDAVLQTVPEYSADGKTSDTVYYSIHINATLETAITKYVDSIKKGTLSRNNNATFPIGSLETKVSWVPVTSLPSEDIAKNNYYTTMAAVTQGDGTVVKEQVALLGMHVVGVVINHPEFIWATFEHNSLAPVFDVPSNTASSDVNTLIFKKGSVTGVDGIRWKSGKAVKAEQTFGLFKYGVAAKGPNNYVKTSQPEPDNYNKIDSLNMCVSANLKKESDVWQNYQYDGAIWLNMDGLTTTQQADTIVSLYRHIKDATPGSMARGSLASANLTMETFTQTYQTTTDEITDASKLINCFSCHRGAPDTGSDTIRSPLYLSHVFSGNVSLIVDEQTPTEIEANKLKAFMKVMSKSK